MSIKAAPELGLKSQDSASLPPENLILVWGKSDPRMGPRDIVDPAHPCYDPSIHAPWDDISTDEGVEFAALVNSISSIDSAGKLTGILSPIKVARDGLEKFYPVIGRRRTLAARMANKALEKAKVEARVFVPFTLFSAGIGSVIAIKEAIADENMNRRVPTPTEKAAWARIMIEANSPKDRVMARMGVTSWQAVENILALNDLVPEVKQMVDAGQISQTAARKVAELEQAKQTKAAEAAKGKKGKQAESAVKAAANGAAEPKPETRQNVTRGQLERIQAVFSETKFDDAAHANTLIPARSFLDYLLTGDKAKLLPELQPLIEKALEPKKRGPKTEVVLDQAEIEAAKIRSDYMRTRFPVQMACRDSLSQWLDEGQDQAQNPDEPDIYCQGVKGFPYKRIHDAWTSAYEKSDKKLTNYEFFGKWLDKHCKE